MTPPEAINCFLLCPVLLPADAWFAWYGGNQYKTVLLFPREVRSEELFTYNRIMTFYRLNPL